MRRAPAVDIDHLTRNVRRLGQQEAHRPGDIAGFAGAFEQRVGDNARPRLGVKTASGGRGRGGRRAGAVRFFAFRPKDRAGRHSIDAHCGCQLDRQRPRQAEQPGLGGAVERIAGQRAFGMHVGYIDDGAARRAQIGGSRLR